MSFGPTRQEAAAAAEAIVEERTACRVCGAESLTSVCDLGRQHIAGAFFKEAEPAVYQRRYPLQLVRCDPSVVPTACGLVQLRHSVSRTALFTDAHYGYRSGINATMRAHLRSVTEDAERLVDLERGDVVLDVGCNDGTLLQSYSTRDLDLVGVDPADEVRRYAEVADIELIRGFFTAARYCAVRSRKARVITSVAMFYSVDAVSDFVRDIVATLDEQGLWIVEVAYVGDMLRQNSFDAICHEHVAYYGLAQIERLLEGTGLVVHDVSFNNMNGGSMRLFIRPTGAGRPGPAQEERVEMARLGETRMGLATRVPYQRFAEAVRGVREDLRTLIGRLRADGKTVYAYGASTKGNVLLQYCGLDASAIVGAADRNPDKWGAHMLGTNIPIISEDEARRAEPDYFLILPYTFLDEFRVREAEYLSGGGKFIVPIPSVKIVGA